MDRGRRGSKHHLIACGAGNPLAVALSAANVNDVTQTIDLVDAVPPMRGKRGRPRRRPRRLFGDGAYHLRRDRLALRARSIQAKIPRPGAKHGSGPGRERWVVERTLSWLHQYRRLRIRYERREDIHEAFLAIGCGLICFKALVRAEALC